MSMPLHLQSRLMQRGQGAAGFMRLPRRALPTLSVEKQKQFINSVAMHLKGGSVTGGLRKRDRQARCACGDHHLMREANTFKVGAKIGSTF